MGTPNQVIPGKVAFADQVDFEEFQDLTTSSTSSRGWVTKLSIVTNNVKPPGFYDISYTADIGQTDKEKRVGFRVQWRPTGSTGWTTLRDVRDGVSIDNQYDIRTGFTRVELTTENTIDVRIQFGQVDDGGTAFIRNVTVRVILVEEAD